MYFKAYVLILGQASISRRSNKQNVVSKFSYKVECRADDHGRFWGNLGIWTIVKVRISWI